MSALNRILLVVPMVAILSACSASMSQRETEGCVIFFTSAGAFIGSAVSGGSAIVPGAAGGALVSTMVCGEDEAPPAPAPERQAAVGDSDGDGVNDDMDRCRNTPAGARVDSRGCALDSDGDGVADYRDNCPNTSAGVRVDRNGCPLKDEVVLTVNRLGFAFDSAALDASSRAALDKAVAVIKAQPTVKLGVVGYTDSTGPESYNQGLSERRAAAAVEYLVSKGVPRSQLTASGRGESNPVASNDTRDGRAQNRRVELVVM